MNNSISIVPYPPGDVVVERVNDTHMEVRWTTLSPVEARGHITHYTISYWPASNSEPVTSITVHNTTNTSYEVLIGGLLPGEAYVVEVSASTAEGDGQKAEVNLNATGGDYVYIVHGESVVYVINVPIYMYNYDMYIVGMSFYKAIYSRWSHLTHYFVATHYYPIPDCVHQHPRAPLLLPSLEEQLWPLFSLLYWLLWQS